MKNKTKETLTLFIKHLENKGIGFKQGTCPLLICNR